MPRERSSARNPFPGFLQHAHIPTSHRMDFWTFPFTCFSPEHTEAISLPQYAQKAKFMEICPNPSSLSPPWGNKGSAAEPRLPADPLKTPSALGSQGQEGVLLERQN